MGRKELSQISVGINADRNETVVELQILDSRGAMIAVRTFRGLTKGFHSLKFTDLNYLANGRYILQIKTSNGAVNHANLIKQ